MNGHDPRKCVDVGARAQLITCNRGNIWSRIMRLAKQIGCMNEWCDRENARLHFHHVQRDSKQFEISKAKAGDIALWDVIQEMRKCIILCQRCHYRLHRKKGFKFKIGKFFEYSQLFFRKYYH